LGTGATYTPPSTTASTYYASQTNVCEGPKTKVTTVINPLPTILATATATSICKGASLTLTASGGNTYGWSNSSALASQTVSPTVTTTYTLTGTDGNSCTNTSSVVVTVNALPTITASATPTTICWGTTATISATGGTSYTWDNSIGIATSATVGPTSTTTYKVTGTNANSCVYTGSVTVNVMALPTVSLSASPASICKGTSSTLTATGATTYAWNNSLPAGATNSVSPTVTTTYTVTGTSSGCTATASATVTVNNPPTITASASSPAICNGNSSTISASGGSSYIWDNGIGSATSKSVSPTTTSTTYKVTGTDANGCTNTGSVSVTVTTPALPTASSKSVSVGAAVPALLATGTLVTWYDSTGTVVFTGLSYTPPVSTASPSAYPYKVTNTVNGCESASITVILTVSACTVTAPTVTPTTQTVCIGKPFAAFTATGTNIKWYGSDQVTVLATGASYTPTAIGDYYASQTNVCEGPQTKVTTANYALPTIGASATPLVLCKGFSTTVSATGGTSFVWDWSGNQQNGITHDKHNVYSHRHRR